MCGDLLNEKYVKHTEIVLKYAWIIRVSFQYRIIKRIREWDIRLWLLTEKNLIITRGKLISPTFILKHLTLS